MEVFNCKEKTVERQKMNGEKTHVKGRKTQCDIPQKENKRRERFPVICTISKQ